MGELEIIGATGLIGAIIALILLVQRNSARAERDALKVRDDAAETALAEEKANHKDQAMRDAGVILMLKNEIARKDALLEKLAAKSPAAAHSVLSDALGGVRDGSAPGSDTAPGVPEGTPAASKPDPGSRSGR